MEKWVCFLLINLLKKNELNFGTKFAIHYIEKKQKMNNLEVIKPYSLSFFLNRSQERR